MEVRQILLRTDTAANWLSVDPVLGAGEIGTELDTLRLKVGDGISAWSALPYARTDLTLSRDASTVTVGISGDDAVLPAATGSLAGVMSAADKAKLDGITTIGDVETVSNNVFTGANSFFNASGQTFGTDAQVEDGIVIAGRDGGSSSYRVRLQPAALDGNHILTLPSRSGTVITTADSGTVTSAMIATGTIVNEDIAAAAAIADTKLDTITTAGKVANSATTATSANTASAIVARDGSGNFTAGTITAALSGNAATASAFNASRTLSLSGDVTGSVASTFAGDVAVTTAIAAGVIVNADINAAAAIADTKLDTIATADKVSLSALNIDGATDIGSALADSDLFVVDDGGVGSNRKAAATRISDYTFAKVSGDLSISSAGVAAIGAAKVTNAMLAGSIADSKLSTISTAGKVANSATTATNLNTASAIVARDASGNFAAGTITAALSGNATTATALQNARTINGVSFDGSANITITASTPNLLTFNNSGTGGASGTNFNGGAAITVSYNTVGAPSTTGTNASGTWGISITGNAATVTNGVYTSGDQSIAGAKTFSNRATFANGLAIGPTPGDFNALVVTRTIPAGDPNAGNEATELLLFHSNDPANGSGPDFITLRAPSLRLQTYNNATVSDPDQSGGWNNRLTIDPDGVVNIPGSLRQAGHQVLHAGNYTSYAPGLTGTGASGTWGISVTGNAGSVTNGVYTTGAQTIGGDKTFTGTTTLGWVQAGLSILSENWAGGEGGQFIMQIPQSSALAGNVVVDLNGNSFRVFEGGGANRGFYVDLTGCGTHSHLLHSHNFNAYAPTLLGVGASGTWGISVTGNAATATKLATPRTINGVSFDGSANITIPASIANAVTFNNGGSGAASGTSFDGLSAVTVSYNTIGAPSTTGTNASGTWGIGISGNAATATKLATARAINGVNFDGTGAITITANTANALTFNNSGAGAASGSTFNGGSALTISYNSVGAPSTTGTNASGTWGISITGSSASTTGSSASCTGNAATATKLATARTLQIGSTSRSFDGSGNATWTHAEILPGRLGTACQGVTDWNDVRENGWYMAADGLNAPGPGWYMGIVEVHNDLWVTQTLHLFAGDGAVDPAVYRRGRNNGSWEAWYRLRISEAECDARYALVGGSNATGTWGISISGNAATVTNGVYTNANNVLTGSNKISVMAAVDGGTSAGIYLWHTGDNAWGIYMGTAGAGKSMAGGAACSGITGRGGHHTRNRIFGGTGNSFVWENSSENCLMELTADTGHLYTRGNIYAGNSTSNLVLHAGNYNSYAPTLTGAGASGSWGISITGNAATVSNGAYTNAVNNFVNNRQFFSAAAGNATHDVWSGAIEIREAGLVGNTNTTASYAPAITFHWSMVVATAIKMFSDGSIRVTAQGNTGSPVAYQNFYANTIFSNGNQVLHAGNVSTYAVAVSGSQTITTMLAQSGATNAAGVFGISAYNTSGWSGISMVGLSSKALGMHYGGDGNVLRFGRYSKPANAASQGNWESNPIAFNLDNGDASFVGGVAVGGSYIGAALTVNGEGDIWLVSPDNTVEQKNEISWRIEDGSEGARISAYREAAANAPHSLAFAVRNSSSAMVERLRIDSSGRLLVGTSSARSNFFNTDFLTSYLQVEQSAHPVISCVKNSNDEFSSYLILGKTRGAGNTIVNSGDSVGAVSFQGNDGAEFVPLAEIIAFVDGTPGANDMPGRLVFSTTADGASSPTERMRIDSSGNVGIGLSNPSQKLHVNGSVLANSYVLGGVGTNEIKNGTGDGASYTTYNLTIRSWWGIGFRDYTDNATANAFLDCRTGSFSTKGTVTAASAVVNGDAQVSSINSGPLAGFRNKIINGAMEVSQRGTSFTNVADSTYTLDRFLWAKVGAMLVTIAASTDAPNDSFNNSLHVAVTTADTSLAAGEYAFITYKAEGYDVRDLRGKTFTLSFWVKSAKTGTHCVSFRNSGTDRSYVATYTVAAANTWEFKTITIANGLITDGTWNWTNGVGLNINFILANGSSFQTATTSSWQTGNFLSTSAQVNIMDSTANNFYLTGVQLELGSVVTPFEKRSIGTELALCERYYEKGNYATSYYYSTSWLPVVKFEHIAFRTTKRGVPVIGGTFTGGGWTGTWSTGNATDNGFSFGNNATTNAGTFGHSATWTASAEL